jgi:hypothetical protein
MRGLSSTERDVMAEACTLCDGVYDESLRYYTDAEVVALDALLGRGLLRDARGCGCGCDHHEPTAMGRLILDVTTRWRER